MFGDKSPFATTAFGGSAPPFQMGLAVELTSTFNSTTGYSWKQLLLDTGASPAAYAVPTYYRTGDMAFTPDNDQTLTSGTKGWLELDPQAKGFIFVPTTPASSSTVSAWKEPVRVATTTAGTLASSFENGDTVDGVVLATGDRILLKNQASASENGIRVVAASGAPARATDCDTGSEFVGATVYVSEGTVNKDTYWTCTTNAPITVGVTNTTWEQTPSASTTVAGYVNLTTQTFLGTKNIVADTTGTYGGITFAPNADVTNFSTISLLSDYTNPTTKAGASISTVSGSPSYTSISVSADASGSATNFIEIFSGNNGTTPGDWPRIYLIGTDSSGGGTTRGIEAQYSDLFGTGDIEYLYLFGDYIVASAAMYAPGTVRTGTDFSIYTGGTVYTGATGTMPDGSTLKGGIITAIGATGFNPPTLTDAAAANNTIYYSSTQSKLCYKDGGGVSNALY